MTEEQEDQANQEPPSPKKVQSSQQAITQPQIKLEPVACFGLNRPHVSEYDSSEVHNCQLIHFLKLPNAAKQTKPIVQIATVVGKQVCIRNLSNVQDNDPQFLPFSDPISRVTSMCSSARFEKSHMAVAAMDYERPDLMVIEVFDTSQKKLENMSRPQSMLIQDSIKSEKKNSATIGETTTIDEKTGKDRERIELCSGRFKVPIPARQKEEEKKEPEGCEFHSKKPLAKGLGALVEKEKEAQKFDHAKSYVSRMCFSTDLNYLGVLVTGGCNGILVYKWAVKVQPFAEKWFDIPESKSTKMPPQFCTGIQFNPSRNTELVCNGPKGLLSYYEFRHLVGGAQFEAPDPVMAKDIIPKNADVTGQCWQEDGNFVACCTTQGHVIIYSTVKQAALFKHQYQNESFVHMELNSHGLVLATEKCKFFFFSIESQDEGKILTTHLICNWSPQTKVTKTDDMNRLFYEFSTVDLKVESMTLAVALRNQNVVITNIGKQVFSSIYRNEHNRIQANTKPTDPKFKIDLEYQMLANGFHTESISGLSLCLQRPILMSCSQKDQMIKIFNYTNGMCEISINFTVIDQTTKQKSQEPMQCAALHPSGYMIAVGMLEQIKLFHVMHQAQEVTRDATDAQDGSMRLFAAYDVPIKKVKQMAFSNGGHLLVAADKKLIYVMTTYGLELITSIQSPSSQVSKLCFNTSDTTLIFISDDGFLQRFDMVSGFKKKADADVRRNFEYKGIIHVPSENNECMVLTCGREGDSGAFLRTMNDQDNVGLAATFKDLRSGTLEKLRINDLCMVTTLTNKISNIVCTTNRGAVQVIERSKQLEIEKNQPKVLQSQLVHLTEGSHVKVTVDNRYVISAGLDGCIFVFKVKEMLPNQRKQADDEAVAQIGIDNELGKIVLVNKSLMDDWRKKQEQLRQQMEEASNQVESSLRGEKYEYEKKIADLEKIKHQELQELNKEYEALQMAEAEQKDENTQHMKKLEITHTQYKEELQELYEKKLQYEQQQLHILIKDQNAMEQAFNFEISSLTHQHEQSIEILLQDFKHHLQRVQERYEQSKRDSDGLKMINEEKLNQQEFEQDGEINKLKTSQTAETEALGLVIVELTQDIEALRWQQGRLNKEIEMFKTKTAEEQRQTANLLCEEEHKKRQIQELEDTKKIVQKNLKRKEEQLYSQKFKIKDLQKTKQVLTHRTLEMKASLEPKEQQIEQLKGALLDMEGLFEINNKSVNDLKSSVLEKDEFLKSLKLKLEKLEKQIRSKYQAKISQFQNRIQKIEQTKNNEMYIEGLMGIYDDFVKSEADKIKEQKRKDPETIEELDRQLKYMEKMATALKVDSEKNQQKAKQNVKARTEENLQLIDELTALRQGQKLRGEELNKLEMDIQGVSLKIKRQEDEIFKLQEAMKKISHVDAVPAAAQEQLWKQKERGESEQEIQRKHINKGKIQKGPMFKSKPLGIYKAKIAELIQQLQENNQTILMQRLQISTLHDEYIESMGGVQDLGIDIEAKNGHSAMSNFADYNRMGEMHQE